MRILLAEDNDDLRELLTLSLERHGWEIFAAKDGRDALRMYHNAIAGDHHFDVLLIDVEMPRLNGFGVGANVRNFEKYSNVPRAVHIYFTGYDDVVPPEELLDAGFADGYLRKPIDSVELIAEIESLVNTERGGPENPPQLSATRT